MWGFCSDPCSPRERETFLLRTKQEQRTQSPAGPSKRPSNPAPDPAAAPCLGLPPPARPLPPALQPPPAAGALSGRPLTRRGPQGTTAAAG